MSKNSLILVLQNKQENSTIDRAKIVQTESRAQVYLNALQRCSLSYAKIQIKSEKLTPFGGIFSIMEQFDSTLSPVIDSTLGLRCRSFGYRYSEIIRSLMSIISKFSNERMCTRKKDVERLSCGFEV